MVDMMRQVAPPNPLGEGAGQLMLVQSFDVRGLNAELRAVDPGIGTVIHAPADADEPVSPDNPAWLHWSGPAGAAAVRKVVKNHDPKKVEDATRKIPGSAVARQLAAVREKIQAGQTLDAIEVTAAIGLLLGVEGVPFPPVADSPTG